MFALCQRLAPCISQPIVRSSFGIRLGRMSLHQMPYHLTVLQKCHFIHICCILPERQRCTMRSVLWSFFSCTSVAHQTHLQDLTVQQVLQAIPANMPCDPRFEEYVVSGSVRVACLRSEQSHMPHSSFGDAGVET